MTLGLPFQYIMVYGPFAEGHGGLLLGVQSTLNRVLNGLGPIQFGLDGSFHLMHLTHDFLFQLPDARFQFEHSGMFGAIFGRHLQPLSFKLNQLASEILDHLISIDLRQGKNALIIHREIFKLLVCGLFDHPICPGFGKGRIQLHEFLGDDIPTIFQRYEIVFSFIFVDCSLGLLHFGFLFCKLYLDPLQGLLSRRSLHMDFFFYEGNHVCVDNTRDQLR